MLPTYVSKNGEGKERIRTSQQFFRFTRFRQEGSQKLVLFTKLFVSGIRKFDDFLLHENSVFTRSR